MKRRPAIASSTITLAAILTASGCLRAGYDVEEPAPADDANVDDRDASALDASAPDASAPDASAPDASALDASAPDASALDASAPDVGVAADSGADSDAGQSVVQPRWTIAWQYRKRLTIQGSQVVGTQSDFPVLISFASDASLSAHAGMQSGADILFMQDDTQLPHEVERFDPDTGSLTAWVRVSTLQQAVNSELFMYYGNETAPDQQNPAAVWDDHFISVHHLSSNQDSTSNHYDLVATHGAMPAFAASAGTIGGGATIAGQTLTLDVNHDGQIDDYGTDDAAELDGIPALTTSAWVRMTQLLQYQPVVSKSGVDAQGMEHPNGMWLGSGGSSGGEGPNDMVFAVGAIGMNAQRTNANVLGQAGALHYWTAVYDGQAQTRMRLYLDGVERASTPYYSGTIPATTPNTYHPVHIAPPDVGTASTFRGVIDEVRISNATRSPSWIRTEYNNQSAPAAFVIADQEESRD